MNAKVWDNFRAHESLIRKIAGKYRKGRSVRWAQAFSEHPEWQKTLLVDGAKMTQLHIHANRMNKEGQLFANGKATREIAVRRSPIRKATAAQDAVEIAGVGTVDGRTAKLVVSIQYLD
jgi:hypothetical protein